VVTAPPAVRYPANDLAVLIPNAGFLHHVGPWHLHVDLALKLAEVGLTSLRFDLSGLGDSELPRRREAVAARKAADIADAIGLLTSAYGVRRIVMVGLCSGAMDSHRTALVDDRICGVVLLDPPAYPDRLFHLLYWAERVLNPARVLRFLGRRAGEWAGVRERDGARREPRFHRPPTPEEFAGQIESATTRGCDYLFTYMGNGDYKHPRQLYSILTPATPRDRITVYYFRRLDHTQVLADDRRLLVGAATEWIRTRILAEQGGRPPRRLRIRPDNT
jgi:hypothetical protein